MSDELSKSEKSGRRVKIIWISLIFCFGYYLFEEYSLALISLLLAIFFIILHFLLSKFDSLNFVLLTLILIVCGLIEFYFYRSIISYKVEQAPQKNLCGTVENVRKESLGKGATARVFDLVGENGQQKFLFKEHQAILTTVYPPICIRYSIDTRWDRYPHIFEIYPESSR